MRRRGIVLGCLLGFGGGVLIGSGWAGREVTIWLPGVLMTGLAVLLLIYFVSRSPLAQPPRHKAGVDPSAAPPLGEMLLGYGLISEAELEAALERQSRTKRRLGRILVEMKLATHREVADVLEEQWSRRSHAGPTAPPRPQAGEGARPAAATGDPKAEPDSREIIPEVIVRPEP